MTYKVILLGDMAVGKTSFVRRYMYNDFVDFHTSTIVTSFVSKQFDTFRLDIWDSAGQERFQSLVQLYFRGANAALVLFSAADFKNTFERAKFWISSVKERTIEDIQIVLVENKIDVTTRETDEEQVKQYAEDNGLLYLKASAKTGQGVTEAFEIVVNDAKDKFKSVQPPKPTIIGVVKDEGKKGCCK